MALPTIEPITDATLPEFAAFLERNMGKARSADTWATALRHQWLPGHQNYGFVLRDRGNIVGGIGAIYAQREIGGKQERTCNITSWCVLDQYRQQSTRLLMALIGQPGLHFTNFSPTKVVAGILQFMKFKPLDGRQAILFNLPRPGLRDAIVVDDSLGIEAALGGSARKAYADHVQFQWLRHVAVRVGAESSYIVYKRTSYRGFPAARIIHRSSKELFELGLSALSWHLLLRGMLTTHLDRRLLSRLPPFAVEPSWSALKLYCSTTLAEDDIDPLYSESVVLDI